MTLNSSEQNILDYQHSRQVALSDTIESVKKENIGAANQVNQVGGDKQLFTWLKGYAGWCAMNIWDWIDYLARGLKKAADQSQQNYQQIHAYVDGHDKEIINQVGNLVHDAIKLRSPGGTVYEITVDDDGKLNSKKVGE